VTRPQWRTQLTTKASYQADDPPAKAALLTSLASLLICFPQRVGTDGNVDSITPLGDTQGIRRIRDQFADLQGRMAVYLASVVLVVAAAAILLLKAGWGVGSPVAVGEWRGRISLRGNVWVSISLFPSVFAAVLFGPLAGMIVFAASALGLRIPAAGRVVYFCNRALIGCASGAAAAVVVALFRGGVEETVAAATIAALAAELVDAALTSITFSLRGLGRWTEPARDLLPVIAASIPFYGPVVVLCASTRSPTMVPHVSRAEPAHRRPSSGQRAAAGGEPFVRHGPNRNTRC
jgi:hypothetical protein